MEEGEEEEEEVGEMGDEGNMKCTGEYEESVLRDQASQKQPLNTIGIYGVVAEMTMYAHPFISWSLQNRR